MQGVKSKGIYYLTQNRHSTKDKKTSPAVFGVFFICSILPRVLSKTGFGIDYGFIGVMLPVLVYFGKDKNEKLFLLSIGLLILGASSYSLRQLFAICSVPILALYNGERGERNMKYFFYAYYPLHLAIIFLIGIFLAHFNIL